MEPIANTNVSVSVTALGTWTPGTLILTPIPGTTLIDGDPNIGMTLAYVASGCTNPPNNFSAGGGTIIATSMCKIDSTPTLRKGDTGFCAGAFIPPSGTGSIPCSCTVEIDDAGQSNVKCD